MKVCKSVSSIPYNPTTFRSCCTLLLAFTLLFCLETQVPWNSFKDLWCFLSCWQRLYRMPCLKSLFIAACLLFKDLEKNYWFDICLYFPDVEGGPQENESPSNESLKNGESLKKPLRIQTLRQLLKSSISIEVELDNLESDILMALQLLTWRNHAKTVFRPGGKPTGRFCSDYDSFLKAKSVHLLCEYILWSFTRWWY